MARGRPVSSDGKHYQISLNVSDDVRHDLDKIALLVGTTRSGAVAWLVARAKERLTELMTEDVMNARTTEEKQRIGAAHQARAEAAHETNSRRRHYMSLSRLDGYAVAMPEDWDSAPARAVYNRTFKCWIVPRTRKAAGKLFKSGVYNAQLFGSLDDLKQNRPMTPGEIRGTLERWKLDKKN